MLDLFFNSTLEDPLPEHNKKPSLYIVGTPLSDHGTLSLEAISCINYADLIIAESKKNTFRYLKQTDFKKNAPLFFLDNIRPNELEDLKNEMKKIAQDGGQTVLFSDTGMPLLFDPGTQVLSLAREFKYDIHSVPSATSWGSACALTGWAPPFLIYGFLPRDSRGRKEQLQMIKTSQYHTMLMETPYRFEALLSQISEICGKDRQLFLAWEISKPEEKLRWGSVQSIQREAEKTGLKKGEFILIIQGLSRLK